jgi:hypothetical protein
MYARNNNTGYLSGDPHDYLYLDIGEAKDGNIHWLTYDEMRKRASGEWYDCFTDETCYGYNWDYDMEHFIPALKEYANAKFYNRYIGMTDYYGAFKQYVGYGDYPDFEDDEWWDIENEIIEEGEDQYHYFDNVTTTKEFEAALYDVLLNDDELADECADSDRPYESICEEVAYELRNADYPILLRDNVMSPGYTVKLGNNYYVVDGDYIWDSARYFAYE